MTIDQCKAEGEPRIITLQIKSNSGQYENLDECKTYKVSMIKYLADLNNLHINIQFIIVLFEYENECNHINHIIPSRFLFHSPKIVWANWKEISETFSPPTVSDLKEENMQNVGSKFPLFKIFSLIVRKKKREKVQQFSCWFACKQSTYCVHKAERGRG